ncbi:uncharacterized protein [Trachinotus anak]|uniref:uncharacterized protein n=1 Tax=Trachinotus anak TaxID=443729 RepID=UPI0039F22532
MNTDQPKATVTPSSTTTIPAGGRVTLTCSVDDSDDWRYDWFRRVSRSSAADPVRAVEPGRDLVVSEGGLYLCRGRRGDPEILTEKSNDVLILKTGWRFSWYKAVPDVSHTSYSYELLPGSSSGTEQDSYIVHVTVAVSRHESSSFPVWLILGLVCGIVLIVLLLLLYRCRQSKGDISLEAEDAENGEPQDVTYSSIELKNIGKKHKHREPAETSVYSDIKTRPADNRPLYAQVNINTKEKAKKKKGKSAPAATDDSVYSEVKNPGTAFGL